MLHGSQLISNHRLLRLALKWKFRKISAPRYQPPKLQSNCLNNKHFFFQFTSWCLNVRKTVCLWWKASGLYVVRYMDFPFYLQFRRGLWYSSWCKNFSNWCQSVPFRSFVWYKMETQNLLTPDTTWVLRTVLSDQNSGLLFQRATGNFHISDGTKNIFHSGEGWHRNT